MDLLEFILHPKELSFLFEGPKTLKIGSPTLMGNTYIYIYIYIYISLHLLKIHKTGDKCFYFLCLEKKGPRKKKRADELHI